MEATKELAHWFSIVLIAIVGIALFKVLAGKVSSVFPPLADLAAFI